MTPEPHKETETDKEIWEKAKTEHKAIGQIIDALKPHTTKVRRRILDYLWDKYVVHPDPPPEPQPELLKP